MDSSHRVTTSTERSEVLACAMCTLRPRNLGLLCGPCRQAIAGPPALLPQQLFTSVNAPTRDALIDQWGCPHSLGLITLIGRETDDCAITILEATVSRRHACVSRVADDWQIRDLASANGTFINATRTSEGLIDHGDTIMLGSVAFYVAIGLGVVTSPLAPCITTGIRPLAPTGGLRSMPITVDEPTGGGGGVVKIESESARLSATQLELFATLARRMVEDHRRAPSVRGYVRSSELLGSLSWETRTPEENHVKQLVRRTRRSLLRLGLGDLIEARHGFGYRLRVVPRR